MEINNPYPTYEEALDRGCSKERAGQLHDLRVAFSQGFLSLREWLDEPCVDDHSGYQVKDGVKTIIGKPHRYLCSLCWNELKGSIK